MTNPGNSNPKSFGERLNSISSRALYLILIIVISASVFPNVNLPNAPSDAGRDFFAAVMSVPENSTIVIQSDFTNSTRGESAGQLEALVRVLVRRNIRFVLVSVADAQAPQVATDIINRVIAAEGAQDRYRRWTQWVRAGYYPNAEAAALQVNSDIRKLFAGRRDISPEGPRDILTSPVLQNVNGLDDIALYINITGSKTLDVLIGRVKFPPATYGNVTLPTRLGSMCTGVMGPETLNFYQARQIFGVAVGLNGVVEIETLMDRGLNDPNRANSVKTDDGAPVIPGFYESQNLARGSKYYLALHTAMVLLILAIVAGNVGMALTRKGGKR